MVGGAHQSHNAELRDSNGLLPSKPRLLGVGGGVKKRCVCGPCLLSQNTDSKHSSNQRKPLSQPPTQQSMAFPTLGVVVGWGGSKMGF